MNDGLKVVWPQGWNMGERELLEERASPSRPAIPPKSDVASQARAAAAPGELADLLELHRDGLQVVWPSGWNPFSAALAINISLASSVGPTSRPDPG